MAQLLKHYWIDRDNLNIFALTPEQYSRPLFGTVLPNIEGLEVVHNLTDANGVNYCLSTCPDETVVQETEGLSILTQAEWDAEIASYDTRQEAKRWGFIRKYRDQLLNETDWITVKSTETGENLSTTFKDWRQGLRDLPAAATFPIELPAAPVGVSVSEKIYSDYVAALRGVHMINDPLPPAESTPPTPSPE